MRKRKISTFTKMTAAFVLLGLLPMALFSQFFIMRYTSRLERVMIENMQKVNAYTAKNVEEIITSVDNTLSEVYEWTFDDGSFLYELLKDDTVSAYTKRMNMNSMIKNILNRNDYVSSVRFQEQNGEVYVAYRGVRTVVRSGVGFANELTGFRPEEYRKLYLEPAFPVDRYMLNAEGYCFTLVRNYMDTSSLKNAREVVLGTIYMDVDTELIRQFVSTDALNGAGGTYVVNLDELEYLYSDYEEDYGRKAGWLRDYAKTIRGNSGRIVTDDGYLLYTRIGDKDCYVIQNIKMKDMMRGVLTERNYLAALLILALAVLLYLYYIFSVGFNRPVRQLAEAMKQLQLGDLKVRVEVHSNDELQDLGEGFNLMVQDLNTYINQVYKASIAQKDAELNALKMQIRPHYLYNTLDVIRMKAIEHGENQVAELLESLSGQLRYLTDNKKDQVTLREELNNIKGYFFIIAVRYERLYELEIQVQDADLTLLIPKLVLQPIVENAVRHGLRARKGTGKVMVKITRREMLLEIIVMDNGIGMTKEQNETLDRRLTGGAGQDGGSIGLKNVQERIRYYYGDSYGLTIQGQERLGTIVTYRLPVVEAVEAEDRALEDSVKSEIS